MLDLNCKAHEIDNLYVTDASFFPSIGAVNPTLTIIANALRVGDHVISSIEMMRAYFPEQFTINAVKGFQMAFKVQVGPAQIAIHQGQTVLVTEPDGQVNWPSTRGLYFRDTRVISAWAIYANGELWDLLNGGAIAYHAARIFQTNRAFVTEDGPIAARTLGLVIGRHIDGGLHEDIDITNNSQKPVRFNLEIAIRADFADIFEVKEQPNRTARSHHHIVVA